jgi:hypothetical protein
MNIKNGLICVVIVAVLSLCTFNNVAAAPASKLTPDTHSNYVGDARGDGQQTYILATLNSNETKVTGRVGQSVYLQGVLSSGTPPASWRDSSHGIPNATVNVQCINPYGNASTVNIQNMFSDENEWTTVYTVRTNLANTYPVKAGTFILILTPEVVGVYTYRVTYDGDSQYAPAVSNNVTLTVPYW